VNPRGVELDAAARRWAQLFPADLGTARLTSEGGLSWVAGLGVVAEVHLFDADSFEGPHGDVVVAERLEDLDGALEHVAEAIARLKGGAGEVREALGLGIDRVLGLRRAIPGPGVFAPTEEERARRERALATSMGRFEAVAGRMQEVYGLRLPRHLAVWDALTRSLSSLERRGLEHIGRAPWGIMLWFEDGGLERPTRDGLDPRLEGRFRQDPPEFVTVMSGDTDGLHHGLWYDDPAELPSFLVHNYARDSAETWAGEVTVLRELTADVERRIEEPDYPDEPAPLCVHALGAALEWFADADEAALASEGFSRWMDVERDDVLGGLGPALPPGSGAARTTPAEVEARVVAYGQGAPEFGTWIAQARGELSRGEPAFALVLGRELHWLDGDRYRADALSLLGAAYRALGREALARIAEVHHSNRDLRSVEVFERG
jgi:hypothetical protein